MPDKVTPKERWLAAIHLEPVDRLPFWPKLDGSYARAQAAPFNGMSITQLHKWIGSDNHVWIPACVKEVRKDTSVVPTRSGDTMHRTFETPNGRMSMVERFDEGSQAWHPIEFPIKTGQDAGRDLVLHMCGHLKALLPDLEQLPVAAFEAFTSPTLGNTTLLDGRTDCPEKCLIGGTNAMLWTRDTDAIVARIESDLAELPHHRGIAVTSAGVMPPLAAPDTIKAVCDRVARYPVRN